MVDFTQRFRRSSALVAWLSAILLSVAHAEVVAPTASTFLSYRTGNQPTAENQYNTLTSGVTAQITVQDTGSGLLLPTPGYTPRSGVYAYYRLEDTGNPIVDSSGGGHHATGHNLQHSQTGVLGTGIGFNGTNAYIDLPDLNPDLSAGITIEAWVKYNGFNAWSRIVDIGNGEAVENILFANQGGSPHLAIEVFDNTQTLGPVVAPNVLTTGEWTHVAATVDNTGAANLYKNGVQVGSGVTYAPNSVNRTSNFIGRSNWAVDGYLNGTVDEVRIFNRVLTPEEIAADAAKQFNVSVSTTGGLTWTSITSTQSTTQPYVTQTGTSGSTAAQTLSVHGLTLARSTHSVVCNGVAPCGATNQLRFFVEDVDHNTRVTGPYAILADTRNVSGITATTVGAESITATWNLLAGATGYNFVASPNNEATPNPFAAFNLPAAPPDTLTGLSPNTTYYIYVQAHRSGYSLDYVISEATVTLAATVLGLELERVDSSSITLSWNALFSGQTERYTAQASTSSDFSGTVFSSTTADLSQAELPIAGLNPSTTYYYRVATFNSPGTASYTATSSTITPAISAGSLAVDSTEIADAAIGSSGESLGAPIGQTVTLAFNQGLDASTVNTITLYDIQTNLASPVNTAGPYTSDVLSKGQTAASTPVYDNITRTVVVTPGALQKGHLYAIVVPTTVRDASNNPLTAESRVYFQTIFDATVVNKIVPLLDPSPVEVSVPANAFNTDFFVRVNDEPMSSTLLASAEAITEANQAVAQTSNRLLTGYMVEVTAWDGSNGNINVASGQLTLSFQLPTPDAQGFVTIPNQGRVRADRVAIYELNESNKRWERVASSQMDASTGKVSATISHLSVYAAITESISSTRDAHAYPVPFAPSKGHTTITFTNLPSGSKIRVYTLAGELVRDWRVDDVNQSIQWDGRTLQGNAVASGVYFYVVEGGQDRKVGKLVIVR